MPQIVIDNPVVSALTVFLLVLFVWRGGAIFNFRRDQRAAKRDDVDLLAAVKEITAEQMQSLREDLERASRDIETLRGEVDGLKHALDTSNAVVRAAVGYIHTLLAYVSFHLPNRMDVPPAPSLLDDFMLPTAIPNRNANPSSIEVKGPADVRIDVHHP